MVSGLALDLTTAWWTAGDAALLDRSVAAPDAWVLLASVPEDEDELVLRLAFLVLAQQPLVVAGRRSDVTTVTVLLAGPPWTAVSHLLERNVGLDVLVQPVGGAGVAGAVANLLEVAAGADPAGVTLVRRFAGIDWMVSGDLLELTDPGGERLAAGRLAGVAAELVPGLRRLRPDGDLHVVARFGTSLTELLAARRPSGVQLVLRARTGRVVAERMVDDLEVEALCSWLAF